MRYLVILSSVFLVLAWTSVATAQHGISDVQPSPSWIDSIDVGGGSTLDIGSGQGGQPIPIFYDPLAGPWQKVLGNFVAPLTINEAITIAPGGPNWTDWEEQILTPGWVWAGGASLTILGDGTANVTLPNQQTVKFDFPSQGVGTTLIINKVLQWNGGGNPTMPVTINEWPTVPEPGTIVLLISGLLALGLGYIRRRN